jgi:lipopolysaccharide/colanic/teichoic acid biosynthesis glycosyltransferase
MFLLSLVGGCAITTYVLAFYLVMSHHEIPYGITLTTFFVITFIYQALRYNIRWAHLVQHQEIVLILGTGREAQKMWKHIRIHCDHLVAFKGFVRESYTRDAAPDILARTVCTIDSLDHFLHLTAVDTLVLTATGRDDLPFATQAIQIAQACGVRLLCIDQPYEDLPSSPTLQTVCESYVDFERPNVFIQCSRALKAAMDRIFAGVFLLLLTPVALPFLLVYRFMLGESPLVSQTIYGYHRRTFTMWNIRIPFDNQSASSDHLSARASHKSQAQRTALARIGNFLQFSGLHHAPRLWNVCTGDMSLVGPTPVMRAQTPLGDSSRLLRRYTMRPGLCWPEPETSEVIPPPAPMDDEATISYLKHWSLALDWKTFKHWIRSRTRRIMYAISTPVLPDPTQRTS